MHSPPLVEGTVKSPQDKAHDEDKSKKSEAFILGVQRLAWGLCNRKAEDRELELNSKDK